MHSEGSEIMASSDYLGEFVPRLKKHRGDRSALVVIDLQFASASRQHGLGACLRDAGRIKAGEYRFSSLENRVVPTLTSAIPRARDNGALIVFVGSGSLTGDFSDLPRNLVEFARMTDNRIGSMSIEFLDEVGPDPGDIVLRKTSVSAFPSTSLRSILTSNGVASVAFAGVSTSGSVDGSARDAADFGYQSVILSDATCATTKALEAGALRSFSRLFGPVCTADEWLISIEEA